MSFTRYLVLLSFCCADLALLHAKTQCPSNLPSVPLRVVENSLIVVPVHINGSGPYDFIVDTGAQITTLDTSLAGELKLAVQGATGVGGVATYSRSPFAYLDVLAVGERDVAHPLVVIQPLRQLTSADSHIRGILAENFLSHFDLLIDNRKRLLCLDDSAALIPLFMAGHIALSEPYGSNDDMPFTKPIVIQARLSAWREDPLLLRLDSGSNVSVLYPTERLPGKKAISKGSTLRRVVDGSEQVFAVFTAQHLQVGSTHLHEFSFVLPLNSVGHGPPPREDGLLPTMAFQRVFISHAGHFVSLEAW